MSPSPRRLLAAALLAPLAALGGPGCDAPGGGSATGPFVTVDARVDGGSGDGGGGGDSGGDAPGDGDTGPPSDVPAGCPDPCNVGDVRCDGDGVATCALDPADQCPVFGAPVPCPAGQSCSSGACALGCSDECPTAGAATCAGNGVLTCGQHDSDACLDLGAPTACPGGQTCAGGACVTACAATCPSAGATSCATDGGQRTCADDGAGCLTWGPSVPCPTGQACTGVACAATSTCTSDCGGAGAAACSGANGYTVCGVDPVTGCQAESFFIGCQAGNTCASGACAGGCVVPEVMLVVDRSSSMTGPVWDYTSSRLIGLAQDIGHDVKLGVRPFPSQTASCDPGAIVGLALDNAAPIEAALAAPSSSSSTPLAAALSGLAGAFGDPNQGEHVVLITDGSETCGTTADVLAAVQLLANRGTTVHTIGVGAGFDSTLLDALAAAGGGSSRAASTTDALRDVLKDLVATMTGCAKVAFGYGACVAGTCAAVGCTAGHHPCGAACPSSGDATACGDACVACPTVANGAPVCESGACGLTCDSGYALVGGACLDCSPPAASGDLVVNEYVADPGGVDMNGDSSWDSIADEWVEVVNTSGATLNLDGVTLLTGPASGLSVQHVFAPTCLPAGHAMVVFGGGAVGLAQPAGATLVIGDGSLSLNNGGDTVAIQAADGTTLDLFTYTTSTAGVSRVRDPDGSGAFVKHDATSAGTDYSLGTCISGATFPSCIP